MNGSQGMNFGLVLTIKIFILNLFQDTINGKMVSAESFTQ